MTRIFLEAELTENSVLSLNVWRKPSDRRVWVWACTRETLYIVTSYPKLSCTHSVAKFCFWPSLSQHNKKFYDADHYLDQSFLVYDLQLSCFYKKGGKRNKEKEKWSENGREKKGRKEGKEKWRSQDSPLLKYFSLHSCHWVFLGR